MSNSTISDNKKKIGRPPTGTGTLVGVRLQPAELNDLDRWIAKQPAYLSRPEAIRELTKKAIAADAGQRPARSGKPATAPAPPPLKPPRERAKELAVGAVRDALAAVDAPDDVKRERKRKLTAPPETGKIGKAKA